MNTNKIRLRLAHPEELSTVLDFLKEAAQWLQAKGVDYWQDWHSPPQNYIDSIHNGFAKDEFYIVEYDEKIIGCFRLQWDDECFWGQQKADAGYIHSFTIARHLAGKKIGVKVLNEIERICQKNGKNLLRLDCGAEAEGLRRYYEQYGFVMVGTTTVSDKELTLYEKSIC